MPEAPVLPVRIAPLEEAGHKACPGCKALADDLNRAEFLLEDDQQTHSRPRYWHPACFCIAFFRERHL